MTSKKSKKRKFAPRDFLGTSPLKTPNDMPSHFSSSPPSGPRAEQIHIRGSANSSTPARGPRRDTRDDSRERMQRRSRSPPYRDSSPPRREKRSRSRDERRYENNYRPNYDLGSPVGSRPPLEQRRSHDLYTPAKSRPPLEERGPNNNYSPLGRNAPLPEPNRPQASRTDLKDQVSEPPKTKPTSSVNNSQKASEGAIMDTVNRQAQPQQASVSDSIQILAHNKLQEDVAKELGDKILNILDECTDLSSLKAQQHAEKQKLKRRQAEFEKFKPHHEKFPSTKDSQTAAKTEAEKAYKLVSEKIKQKKISLAESAKEAAASIVPTILACGRGTRDSSKDEERLASLEKTCDGFMRLLEEQKKLLDQSQKMNQELEKSYQKLETNHSQQAKNHENQESALREEINNLKSQSKLDVDKLFKQITGAESTIRDSVSQQITGIESNLQQLKTDISVIKTDAASLKQANDKDKTGVSQKLTAVEALAKRVPEINGLQSRLTKLESSSVSQETFEAGMNYANNKYVKVGGDYNTVIESLKKQSKSQETLATKITKLESSSSSVEKMQKGKLDPLVERVQKLESLIKMPKPVAKPDDSELIRLHIDPLKQDLSKLTAVVDGLSASPSSSKKIDMASFDRRLNVVEQRSAVQSPPAAASHHGQDRDSINKRLTVLEKETGSDLALIDRRLSAVEQRPSVQAPAASSQAAPTSSDVTSKLTKLENGVEENRESIQELGDMIGDVVNQAVDAKAEPLERIQKANFDNLRSAFDTLKRDHDNLDNLVQETRQAIADVPGRMTSNATHAAIQTINSQGVFARSDQLDQMKIMLNGVLDGHDAAIGNLQSRVDNINTSDLHKSITCSVLESVPNLMNVEARMNGFHLELQTTLSVLHSVEPRMAELETVGNASTERVQSMRGEIDKLAVDVSGCQTAQKKAGQEFSELKTTMHRDRDYLVDEFARVDGEIAEVKDNVEKVEKAIAEKSQKEKTIQPAAAARPQSSTRQVSPTGSFSSANRGPSSARPHPKPGSVNTTRRPSSVTSDRPPSDRSVSDSRKRPYKQTNGSISHNKANGAGPGSPPAKRARRTVDLGGDDPEKDPDFDPDDGNLVEPRISDSESDELAPPGKKIIDLVSDSE
ncbi:hypothetical protein EG329_006145 [Mollisiaceae sp. DMI_Dod_QoI]|nr:hypothetical protein EG329_006145 [Helotiales sp. DMI_Dod_QoI]